MTDLKSKRIFCGLYPAGIVWADRAREKGGDYARLAFMPYDTLEATIAKDCPKELRPLVEADIKAVQARRGQVMQVSTSGQTVMLGGGE